MDFHPPVTRPAHPGLKIPRYNPLFKYDPQKPFSSYAEQKCLSNFVDNLFDLPLPNALAALQSWLFFGLITEVFNAVDVPVVTEDFVGQEPSGLRYITVKPLGRYLWLVIANVKNMIFDEEDGYIEYLDKSFVQRIDNNEIPDRINTAFATANDVVNQLLSSKYIEKANGSFQALLLSITCLIERLGDARDTWDIFRIITRR